MPARIEHLTEQGVDAVEEDLRQTQSSKCHSQVELVLRIVARRVEINQQWCQQHGRDGQHQQGQACKCEQPIRIGVAAIGVVLHVAHQLRNEDRIQCAADDEDVDDRRQRVAERVGI